MKFFYFTGSGTYPNYASAEINTDPRSLLEQNLHDMQMRRSPHTQWNSKSINKDFPKKI